MSDDAYDTYLSAVRRLPIQQPTDDDVAALLPHLRREDAVAALRQDGGAEAPPIRVRGASHVFRMGTDGAVRRDRTRRAPRSYAPGSPAVHQDVFWSDDATSEAARAVGGAQGELGSAPG